MGELVVLGISIGFVVSTCAFFTGWVVAQVRRMVRQIR